MSDDQTMIDSSQDAVDPDASLLSNDEITFSLNTPATILMRIGLRGLWVNPAIPTDKCAEQMLDVLRPLLQHTIDTKVKRLKADIKRLTRERDEAQAEVKRLTNAGKEGEMTCALTADAALTEYRKRWPQMTGPARARLVTEIVTLYDKNRKDRP